jgi:putative spermidine/putrescine transport system permease protein
MPTAIQSSKFSQWFYRHPRVLLVALLSLPLLWLGVIYLGSLFALLIQSFFSIDEFSGLIIYELTLDSYRQLFTAMNSQGSSFTSSPWIPIASYLPLLMVM